MYHNLPYRHDVLTWTSLYKKLNHVVSCVFASNEYFPNLFENVLPFPTARSYRCLLLQYVLYIPWSGQVLLNSWIAKALHQGQQKMGIIWECQYNCLYSKWMGESLSDVGVKKLATGVIPCFCNITSVRCVHTMPVNREIHFMLKDRGLQDLLTWQ